MIKYSLLLAAAILLSGCGGAGNNNGNGFNVGDPDDDDDSTPNGSEEGEVSGYVEFTRHSEFGSTSAQVQLLSSWFLPVEVEARLPLPGKSDSCHAGKGESDLYGVPTTSLDIGSPSLVTSAGVVLDFELDAAGQYWVGDVEVDDWESHQEYDVVVSGGDDHPGGSYPGALATPAALTLTSLDQSEEGLELEWYGGNDNGDVALRLVQDSADVPGMDLWLVCRLHDDGAATISVEDLSIFAATEVSIELLRSASANFYNDEGTPGVASGLATATTTWTPTVAER